MMNNNNKVNYRTVVFSFVVIVIALIHLGESTPSTRKARGGEGEDEFFTVRVSTGPFCPSSYCSSGETCCTLEGGQPGCCPLANATCCGVQNSCCADGLVCDPVMRDCVQPDTSKYCSDCETVVNHLIDYGCDYACDLLPAPLDVICSLIVDEAHLCEQILNWTTNGFSPKSICMMIGICGGGTCSCGYCTQYLHGRCLSLPNHCPSGTTSSSSTGGSTGAATTAAGTTTTRSSSSSSSSSSGSTSHSSNVGGRGFEAARVGSPMMCVDNTCSSATEGCCLTCF